MILKYSFHVNESGRTYNDGVVLLHVCRYLVYRLHRAGAAYGQASVAQPEKRLGGGVQHRAEV